MRHADDWLPQLYLVSNISAKQSIKVMDVLATAIEIFLLICHEAAQFLVCRVDCVRTC